MIAALSKHVVVVFAGEQDTGGALPDLCDYGVGGVCGR
jgi:hypothetical protein